VTPGRAAAGAQRRLVWLPPLVALLLLLTQSRRFCSQSIYFVDDPFISMRFAANLLEHGELSFNPGQRVEGYSNLLYVLAQAALFVLRGGVPDAVTALDLIVPLVFCFAVLQAALLWRLARATQDPLDAEAWYYAGTLTVAAWPFAFWATAGLETPIEGFFYVALVAAATRLETPGGELPETNVGAGRRDVGPSSALWTIAALVAGITLVRFEGVLVALVASVALALPLVRRRSTRTAVALVGFTLAVGSAYHLWRFAYFGQLMPNTYVAKASGGWALQRIVSGASYTGGWAAQLGGGVALAGLAAWAARTQPRVRAALAHFAKRPVWLVAFAITVTKLALVVFGGGDWMPGFRMLVPVTPLALFLTLRALVDLRAPGGSLLPTGTAAALFAAGLFLCSRTSGLAFPIRDGLPNEAGRLKKVPRASLEVARVLERGFAGSREEVAVGEAGLVPFEARHVRFMDLFGLVDRDMARQAGAMHNKVRVEHFLERRPIAVAFAQLHHRPPYGQYQYATELLPSPRFHEAYRRVALGAEIETLGWALYLRRDADPTAHTLRWAERDPLAEPPFK
jgi:hypothetical protein